MDENKTNKSSEKIEQKPSKGVKNGIKQKSSKEIKKGIKQKPSKEAKKEMKQAKKEGKKKSRARKIISVLIKLFLLFAILTIIAAVGAVVGVYMGLFGEDFILDESVLEQKVANTYLYDKDGNQIAMINSGESRMIVSYAELPEMLPKAYIAIEDERFEKHNGVDIKRTAAAAFNYVKAKIFKTGDAAAFGGSTITQQLVKNATGEKEDSPTRKLKEMSKAIQLENTLSKDQIMELYLNILFMGGNIHGVQTASYYYFGKDVKELNIEECAFLAGITHVPNAYDPYVEENAGKIKTRTKVVLAQMLKLGYIDQSQYDVSVANVEEGLKFKKDDIMSKNIQSYFVEAAMQDVIKKMMEEKGISESLAQSMIYRAGYHIYTTQDTAIQNQAEAVYKDGKYFLKSGDDIAQSSITIIDYKTGQVVAVVGGRGEKQEEFGLNRATQSVRPTGSTMKPIGVYAPALQKGIITTASVYDDTSTTFRVGGRNWTPKNYGGGFSGFTTIRKAIEVSLNIPPAKIIMEMGVDESYKFLQDLGITSLVSEDKNPASLALGGLTYGISTLEMAAAYGAIANDGKYISPTFYTKVTDESGTILFEPKQTTRQVMSPENAYIMKNLLTQPVISGTATNCRISGMDVAAKTGTTTDNKDRWLCGFTGYYAAATWYGYDIPKYISASGNPAANIWIAIMGPIHKNLPGKKFEKPSGISSSSFCRDSGMSPTDLCARDPRGTRVTSDIFAKGTAPSKPCDVHVLARVCTETGKLTTDFCPHAEERVFLKRAGDARWKEPSDAEFEVPTEYCTIHTGPQVPVDNNTTGGNTTNNTTGGNTTNNTTGGNTTNNTTGGNMTNETTNTTNTIP